MSRPFLSYKYSARCCIGHPITLFWTCNFIPPSPRGFMTVSMKTLESAGGRGLPWVTPYKPFKGGGACYPPAFATMMRRTQLVGRSQIDQGPMLYPYRMSRRRSLSRSLYAFLSSKKILYSNASLIYFICWISLVSREAVPIPCPTLNPLKVS